jgi:hypothetical protein
VDVQDPTDDPFLSDEVKSVLGAGWLKPVVKGLVDQELQEVELAPHSMVYDTPHFKTLEWRGRSKNLVVRLWTDLGQGDALLPFVCGVWLESKDARYRQVSAWMECPLPFKLWPNQTATTGITDGLRLQDAEGVRSYGSFLAFSNDETKNATSAAEYTFPLLGRASWGHWGLFGKRIHSIREEEISSYVRHVNGINFSDQSVWPGYMEFPKTGRTGEAPGFGARLHQEALASPAKTAFQDALISTQEVHRPIFFFEEDGERFRASEHPKCILWDERPDFRNFISPDNLGRLFRGYDYEQRWGGHDREHYGSRHLNELCLLDGDPLAMFIADQKSEAILSGYTLPSTHGPTHARNGAGNGRAIGRVSHSIAERYFYSGSETAKKALLHMGNVWEEVILPEWDARDRSHTLNPYFLTNDHRIGFGGKVGIVCWQDAIFAAGAYAIAQAFLDVGKSTLAGRILDCTRLVIKTLVDHYFYPLDRELLPGEPKAHMVQHMLWTGEEPTNWRDLGQAIPSWPETGYTIWAMMALGLMDKVAAGPQDDTSVEKAQELLRLLRPVPSDMRRYDGTG